MMLKPDEPILAYFKKVIHLNWGKFNKVIEEEVFTIPYVLGFPTILFFNAWLWKPLSKDLHNFLEFYSSKRK